MAEPHPGADLEQLFRVRDGRRVAADAKSLRGTPHKRGVARGVGGRKQQESLRSLRQSPNAPQVVVPQITRQPGGGRHPEPAGQLGQTHLLRQFQ